MLVGSAFGHTSPVATLAPTLYLDAALPAGQALTLSDLPPEAAIYPISGEMSIDDVPLEAGCMALLAPGTPPVIRAGSTAQFVVIGGEPLDGPRFISWNFVSSRKERIVQAGEDWVAQRMGQVPGETEWIPLPGR